MNHSVKRTLAVVLAGMTSVSTAWAAAKPLPTEIPAVDPAKYYESPVVGLYGANVTYNENQSRPFEVYYPEGIVPNAPIVYLTVPAGKDAEAFLEESGWKKAADENLIILVAMSANEAGWGEYAEESAYFGAVYGVISSKPYIPVRKHNVYMAAYDGNNLGQKYAMSLPNFFAGILSVDSKGLTEEDAEAFAAKETNFYNDQNEVFHLNEVSYPVWIVAEEETADLDRLVNYFKIADRTAETAEVSSLAENTIYYAPLEENFPEKEFEAVAGVYVTAAKAEEAMTPAFTETVWKKLFESMRRYPTFGEIRSYMGLNTEGSHYTYHEAMVYGGDYKDGYITKPGTEYNRYWYMYTPSNIDELEHVPVVFVLHGSGGGPNEIAEQTGWRLFAEEAGVVLVVPQGSVRVPTAMTTKNGVEYFASGNSWTVAATASAPNDLLFFDYLYDWIQKDYAYADKLDMSRCYVSGQSMGGSCTNNLINYRPQYFAAAAPCSWVFSGKPDSVTAYDIPVVNCMGQKDTTIPGAFSKETGKTAFDYFINRYQLTEKGGKNRTWEDFTWLTNDAVCTEEYKALNLYIYETAKQYPMFIAIEGQGMGHATSCTQVEYIWNTVFSHYTRDPETKVLYYDGDVVDTPVNLALAEKAAK